MFLDDIKHLPSDKRATMFTKLLDYVTAQKKTDTIKGNNVQGIAPIQWINDKTGVYVVKDGYSNMSTKELKALLATYQKREEANEHFINEDLTEVYDFTKLTDTEIKEFSKLSAKASIK